MTSHKLIMLSATLMLCAGIEFVFSMFHSLSLFVKHHMVHSSLFKATVIKNQCFLKVL